MKQFRDELEEMSFEKFGVDYFFDVDKYSVVRDDGSVVSLTDGGQIHANYVWLTCPLIDKMTEDLPYIGIATALSHAGYYKLTTDVILPDINENREEIAEYMRRGPIAFANSMRAWPGSRSFRTYKHFGDAWFDTMAARALLASDYLGHESSPVKRDASGRVKPSGVATGNVIKVNFGGRK
jgi:hypothetical protein